MCDQRVADISLFELEVYQALLAAMDLLHSLVDVSFTPDLMHFHAMAVPLPLPEATVSKGLAG